MELFNSANSKARIEELRDFQTERRERAKALNIVFAQYLNYEEIQQIKTNINVYGKPFRFIVFKNNKEDWRVYVQSGDTELKSEVSKASGGAAFVEDVRQLESTSVASRGKLLKCSFEPQYTERDESWWAMVYLDPTKENKKSSKIAVVGCTKKTLTSETLSQMMSKESTSEPEYPCDIYELIPEEKDVPKESTVNYFKNPTAIDSGTKAIVNKAIKQEITDTNEQVLSAAIDKVITQFKQWTVPDKISEEIRTDFNTSHDDPQRVTVRDMVTQVCKELKSVDDSKLESIVGLIIDAVKTKTEQNVEWTDQIQCEFDGLNANKVFIFKSKTMPSRMSSMSDSFVSSLSQSKTDDNTNTGGHNQSSSGCNIL